MAYFKNILELQSFEYGIIKFNMLLGINTCTSNYCDDVQNNQVEYEGFL